MTGFAHGSFCWADLMPTDQARALAFYGRLAGWTSSGADPELGGYALAYAGHEHPENTTAGVAAASGDAPPGWNVFLATDDIDESLDAVPALGGDIVMGRMDIPGMGSAAMCTEPTGAVFGLWQPQGLTGFGVFGEPGAFCWAEVYSSNAAVTRDFFVALFELDARTISDDDDLTYYGLATSPEAEPTFGVMQLGEVGSPAASSFAAYLFVTDVDQAADEAAEHGATITQPGIDTPFGRLVTLTDSEGATIRIIDPPSATGLI